MFELIIKHDHPDDKSFMREVYKSIRGKKAISEESFLVVLDRVTMIGKEDRLVLEIPTKTMETLLLKFDMEDANINDV